MTVELCLQICKNENDSLAGLRQRDQCHCGSRINEIRREESDSRCGFPCSGNTEEKCGGRHGHENKTRMSVYNVSASECQPPRIPTQGSLVEAGVFWFGSNVTFKCDVGFDLLGNRSTQCILDAFGDVTWSPATPVCLASTDQGQGPTPTQSSDAITTATSNPSSRTSVPPKAPLNVGVIVGPLVAGFIIGALVLSLFVVHMKRRRQRRSKQGCVREYRNKIFTDDRGYQLPNKQHPVSSFGGQLEVFATPAVERSNDIPMEGLPAVNDDVHRQGDQAPAYGNVGPNLSFSRDLVTIEKELGRGAFGRVLLGTAFGIEEAGKPTQVAIKTLKEGADRQAKMELLEELDVMKKIGSHPNIVKLLGYCTETDPIYLIVELLKKGDLKKVLMGYRVTDPGSGYGNISGVSPSLSRTLVKFARDVAKGMSFLASQKCIHRDLAARNVLVGEDMVCKVSDFGLARDVMNVRLYQRESESLLPMRWMALESLLDDVYTIESDVWSFGILMWEIVTLGARPYPHLSAKAMVNQLRKGYRMPRPKNCKKQLYSVMRSCWQADPQSRPTFQNVYEKLDALLSEEMVYITRGEMDEHIYEDTAIMTENEKV